LSRIQIQTGKI